MGLSVAISQEPIVADSDQAGRQAVQQEAADELHRADGNGLGAVFLSVLGREGDHSIFKGSEAAVGNGHPMGIAGQVVQDLLRVFDRVAHTDHPVFGKQGGLQGLIPLRVAFEPLRLAGAVYKLHELAAEDQ